MIMIRSNASAQKINKPPPPVPPRPAKNLVQEALAKTRHNISNVTGKENKTNSPVRHAPPPPSIVNNTPNDLIKSNSSYTVNVNLKKPPVYSRSISEEKCTRPVIYQSSNVRNGHSKVVNIVGQDSNEFQKNCNTRGRLDSSGKNQDTREVRRVGSFKDGQPVQLTIANTNKSSFVVNDEKNRLDMEREVTKDEKNDNLLPKSKESTLEKLTISTDKTSDSCSSSSSSKSNSLDKKWDKMLNDRNHVNTLIDEMFASVLEVSLTSDREKSPSESSSISENKIVINNKVEDDVITEDPVGTTVIVISDEESNKSHKSYSSDNKSNTSTNERKVKFDDQMNHEFLINELQNMKVDQSKILRRQRKPSLDIFDSEKNARRNSDNIHMNDWFSVSDSGEEVKMSTCQITIEDDSERKDDDWAWKKDNVVDYERISKMSHLHGLPPLPKSLSGFNILDQHPNPPTPIRSSSIRSGQGQLGSPASHHGSGQHLVYPPHPKVNGDGSVGRKTTNLDTQLAILRREMYSLRQQDLSLLSQLWSLNESIQDFRQILQDQEDRVLSPPSPSPSPSSADEEEYYMSATSAGFRPPSGIHARRMSGSSAASGSVG